MNTRLFAILALLGNSPSCAARGDSLEREITALEAKYDAHEQALADISREQSAQAREARLIVNAYEAASASYKRAEGSFAGAKQISEDAGRRARAAKHDNDGAASDWSRSARDYEAAARNYRIATIAMVVLVASKSVCDTKQTTREFRKRLREQGVSERELKRLDIDHVVPRSKGGIDHPLNYEAMNSSLNRSLGNDVMRKFMHAPMGFIVGLGVSALGAIGGCN